MQHICVGAWVTRAVKERRTATLMGRWMGEEGDGCAIDLGPNGPNEQTKRCNKKKKKEQKRR